MKTKILIILILVTGGQSIAQQEAMYSHYMFNTNSINPAYAGSRDALSFTALGRFQWVGMEGAPITQTLNVHTPIAAKNLGVGLNVTNDKIGPMNTTSLYVDLAYRLKLTENTRLCFGVKGGFNNMTADWSQLTLNDQNDVSFAANMRSKLFPNTGAGIYLQSPKYYVGFSVPKVLNNRFYGSDTNTMVNTATEHRHYYGIAGAAFELNANLVLKPSILMKWVQNAPMQLDINTMLQCYEKFNVGAMYRLGDGLGGMVGFMPNEQFMISYSYDWSTQLTSGVYNGGSHEIMLRYELMYQKEGRIKSPRYF